MKEEWSISLWSVALAVLGVLGIFLGTYLLRNFTVLWYFKKRNVPYSKPVFIFGNMLPMLRQRKSLAEFFQDLYREFPNEKYFGAFEFGNPIYVLRDTELIKSVTVKHFDHFSNHKAYVDESVDPLFGGNLFSMTGERWKEMRSIVSPTFTSSKMRVMFELISKCADDFTDYLEKQPRPLTVEMKGLFTRYTNDVIATAAFGVSVNSLENQENEFYLMGKDATNPGGLTTIKMFLFSWSPTLMKILRQTYVSNKVATFFRNLVKDTISTRIKDGIVRPDLIHQLMQAKHKRGDEKLSIDEITGQAFIFFFAGFDTASTLMSFTCHQLAVHSDIQDKLIAEIDAAYDEDGGKLSYDKVSQLKYLDMVLNETLRYYPPAVNTDRLSNLEFELPPPNGTDKPVIAKPGTRVWIPIFALHHDSQYFPDPEKFDPERFSPENKGSINPFAYMPFGVGPRNCPGSRFALMETKIVLCCLLRKFRICVGSKTQVPLVLSRTSPVMTAEHGFWLDLESRKSAAC
ncbi:cytochrome P450 9e2-like [Diprion similis]|uniref:cytochrome P450 9e2-like n=1 Tax=Diprion similis TaxID=362088 RepID=UPI001EF8DACD|nr:cytochrome P450 9e2-like [Diprion similis]